MYKLLEKDRVKFISLVILNEIIQFQHYFPVALTGYDFYLDPYLKALLGRGLVAIDKGLYVPTPAGRQEIETLYNKYYEYVKLYDIFCAVDLTAGEFAFQSINLDMTDDEWQNFLQDPRFSDVRVAVADFKGIDPLEIVFLSFLNENRFDCGVDGWQNALTSIQPWIEIETICNTAVSLDYLKSEGVIENIVSTGTELAIGLIKQAEDAQRQMGLPEEIIEETTTVTEYVDTVPMPYYPYSYWDPYLYDPFYISPFWIDPILIW